MEEKGYLSKWSGCWLKLSPVRRPWCSVVGVPSGRGLARPSFQKWDQRSHLPFVQSRLARRLWGLWKLTVSQVFCFRMDSASTCESSVDRPQGLAWGFYRPYHEADSLPVIQAEPRGHSAALMEAGVYCGCFTSGRFASLWPCENIFYFEILAG